MQQMPSGGDVHRSEQSRSTSMRTPATTIDTDTAYDPLTDGVLIIRHLFGISGPPLTLGRDIARRSRRDFTRRRRS